MSAGRASRVSGRVSAAAGAAAVLPMARRRGSTARPSRQQRAAALLLAVLCLAAPSPPHAAAATMHVAGTSAAAAFAATARSVDVGGELRVSGYRLQGDAVDSTLLLQRRQVWAPGACLPGWREGDGWQEPGGRAAGGRVEVGAGQAPGWLAKASWPAVELWQNNRTAAAGCWAQPRLATGMERKGRQSGPRAWACQPACPQVPPAVRTCGLAWPTDSLSHLALHPPGATVWVQAAADAPPLQAPAPTTAYYAGTIEGDPASSVLLAVSAAGGISGVARRANSTFVIGGQGAPVGAAGAAAAAAAAPMASVAVAPTAARGFKCGMQEGGAEGATARKLGRAAGGAAAARRRLQQPNFSVSDQPMAAIVALETDSGAQGVQGAQGGGRAHQPPACGPAGAPAAAPPGCARTRGTCLLPSPRGLHSRVPGAVQGRPQPGAGARRPADSL